MRFKAVVAAFLALFWLSLATSPAAAGPSGVASRTLQVPSACGLVEQSQYWFCKALEDKNCGLVSESDEYWFCKGVTEKQCGLIEGSGYYRFCHAVTTRNCDSVGGDGYWLCRGLLEQNCGLARQQHYWMCSALQSSFRSEE